MVRATAAAVAMALCLSGQAAAFAPTPQPGHTTRGHPAHALAVPPNNPNNLGNWANGMQAIASKLDEIIWGGRADMFAPPAVAPPRIDEESVRRRTAQNAVVNARRRALELEAELGSLLRIAGRSPSRMELAEVHRLANALEAVQAAEAAASAAAAAAGARAHHPPCDAPSPSGVGALWNELFAEPGRGAGAGAGVLRRVLRRSATDGGRTLTYASGNMRIEREASGALHVFRRLHGGKGAAVVADCVCPEGVNGGGAAAERCCTDSEHWFWPL